MGEDPGVRVTLDQLAEWIRAVLESEGVPSRIAWSIEAAVMAEADLHGVPSHGVRMLPYLIQALRLGQATRNPNLRVTLPKDGEAEVVVVAGETVPAVVQVPE